MSRLKRFTRFERFERFTRFPPHNYTIRHFHTQPLDPAKYSIKEKELVTKRNKCIHELNTTHTSHNLNILTKIQNINSEIKKLNFLLGPADYASRQKTLFHERDKRVEQMCEEDTPTVLNTLKQEILNIDGELKRLNSQCYGKLGDEMNIDFDQHVYERYSKQQQTKLTNVFKHKTHS